MRGRAANDLAATTRAEFKRHRDRLRLVIRALDTVIEATPDVVRLDAAMLRQERAELQQRADLITEQLRSRSWIYFGLLEAAALAGTDLGYTSPSRGRPHGPGISFLIAAAEAQGYVIGPDRARDLIAIFNKLPRVRVRFAGAGKMAAVVQIFDKDGNEVLDDANRPKP